MPKTPLCDKCPFKTEPRPRKTYKRQWISRAQAIDYAKRVLAGESLKQIAKDEGRSYPAFCGWMNHYGLGVQRIKLMGIQGSILR